MQTGVPFSIVVPTLEGACILERPEHVRVGQGITVELLQVYTRQECLSIGVRRNREVELMWPYPGPFTLVVTGEADGQPVALRFELFALR